MKLKATMITLTAALGLTISAHAGSWTGNRIGRYDYWRSNQGDSYTGTQIGRYYYWSGTDRNGNYHSGTGTRIGRYYYWDDDSN